MRVPVVSIICPVYNTEKVLGKCIKSVLKQDFKDIEIILINDGSTDGSLMICEKYATHDNRILIIDKPNGGRIQARKDGVLLASGEYVFFIDCDDYLEKNAISKLVYLAQKHNLDMVVGNHDLVFDDWGIVSKTATLFKNDGKIFDKTEFITQLLCLDQTGKKDVECYIWGRLYRRSCITAALEANDNQLFPPDKNTILEDVTFNLVIAPFICSYMAINDVIYHYRWGGAISKFFPYISKSGSYFNYRYEMCLELNRPDLLKEVYNHYKSLLSREVQGRIHFEKDTMAEILEFLYAEISNRKIALWAVKNLPSTVHAEMEAVINDAKELEIDFKKNEWKKNTLRMYEKLVNNVNYYINSL